MCEDCGAQRPTLGNADQAAIVSRRTDHGWLVCQIAPMKDMRLRARIAFAVGARPGA